MIKQIQNIGEYVEKVYPERSPVESMVNRIKSEDMKYVLIANIQDGKVTYNTVDFYRNVTMEALFCQQRRLFLGGGMRLDYYEQLDAKKEPKGRKKLKAACDFCEVGSHYEEIKNHIESYLQGHDKNTFLLIIVDGKKPIELFKQKFLDAMYSTMYKELKGTNHCHLCKNTGKTYNTTTYVFYTNDKEIYGNIDDAEKTGFAMCEQCLNRIITGKEYFDKYLNTYWLGKQVMFLPHHYDENVASVYETTEISENNEQTNLINKLRSNEEGVLDQIGKTDSVTDIVFYEDDGKSFNIVHTIQSILPSRFSFLGDLLRNKYGLKLFFILKYIALVKVSLDDIETTNKEQMKMLEAIFTGKKINRNLFFKRVMDVYKYYYLKNETKKFYPMKTINYIYNFLCECGCLEKGWNVLADYKDYNELFEQNTDYFDSNEKKAWFILGKAYDTMIYYMRRGKKGEDGDISSDGKTPDERTSLEKTFFFARKFDFNDFIYFSNLLSDKAIKYKSNTIYFKNMLCEAKELMARKEGKLSFDEAKYLFFWGMDSYFKKEDDKQEDTIKEEGE